VPRIREVLGARGFVLATDELPVRFVMAHPLLGRIDFHTVTFDHEGGGNQAQPNGTVFRYPPEGFTEGSIGGRPVRCISAEVQVLCHLGYEPKSKDIHDVLHLHRAFGIPLPAAYRCRADPTAGEEPLERTRRSYDRIASRFLARTCDRSVVGFWLDRFASRLPADALVLDAGGGPGFDAAELRARGLRAVCADLSLGMLRAGLQEFPGPRVQADLRQLPFGDGSLDGVWANASLLHLPQHEAATALHELRRVLRSDGWLHVSLKQGAGSGWDPEPDGEPRWFQYWSGADLDAALAGAGYRLAGSWVNETPRVTWLVRHAAVAAPGPTRRPGSG
jgi:SAM-dependent methyltransferase